MRYTQSKVRGMTPGEKSTAYFADNTTQLGIKRRLPLLAQVKFHNNPAGAVEDWFWSLPRR